MVMNIKEKIELLGEASKYDACGNAQRPNFPGVCTAWGPDGRCVNLYKVLMTNSCSYDCNFCTNRSSRNCPRTAFEPQELARTFMHLYRGNYVDGLFLSSGVAGDPDRTMEMMIEGVALLRQEFTGYVHMKIIPGASYDLVKRACGVADRVSINVEAPGKDRLSCLSHDKDFKVDILRRAAWVKRMGHRGLIPSGHTTQFVVGPAGESDYEIMKLSRWLYDRMELKRAYYSAFMPVEDTPFERLSRTPLLREHRLFQMDWLTRVYKMKFKELRCVFDGDGNLPISHDPKYEYALQKNVSCDPNDATYEELLLVPGIGPTSAKRILYLRKFKKVGLSELRKSGAVLKRALNFIEMGGKQTRLAAYAK
jgi:putative DNA modification/repair radical SAM protein